MLGPVQRFDSADVVIEAPKLDAQRIDVFHFDGSRVERTPQGGMKIPATLTRTGVFEYRQADGSVRREYRPPSEVFKADSLRTLEDAPVTDLHQGMVRSETYQALSKGHVRDVNQDGRFVTATVLVQDAGLVAAVERGDRREISCGYECTLDPTPGRTDAGESYDAVQTNIRYNHAALLPIGAGRAGREVGLRLDGATRWALDVLGLRLDGDTRVAWLDDRHEACQTSPTMKVRFDGHDYDLAVPAERESYDAAVAAVLKDRSDAKEALTTAEKARTDGATALATVTAERDTACAERDAARADAADARDPVKAEARAEARAKLVAQAREVLGAEAKFDGLSDSQIREKCVLHADSTVQARLDEYKDQPAMRETYVSARFDGLFSTASVGTARAAFVVSQTPGGGQGGSTPAPLSNWTPQPLAFSKDK